MNNKKIIGIGFAVVVLLIAGFLSLPYITLMQIKSAAEAHDGEALSEHVDFPAVRQSLKDQMNIMMAKELSQKKENDPFAAFGAAFGGMFVEKMVDAYITPAGLTQMMSGEKPEQRRKNIKTPQKPEQEKEPLQDAELSYESLSKFSVTITEYDSEKKIKFILRREGLTWRLSEIILPL